MASGGARARSGPAPDPNALRRGRKDDGEWRSLPPAGRPGPPPGWPLPAGKRAARESELWAQLWAKPQAVEWERLGLELEVALYVRRFAEAEEPDAPATLTDKVRQLGEGLGITIPGMLRNRWRIADTDSEQTEDGGQVRAPVKARFTVVDGGA